jgi:hypothetical protein
MLARLVIKGLGLVLIKEKANEIKTQQQLQQQNQQLKQQLTREKIRKLLFGFV